MFFYQKWWTYGQPDAISVSTLWMWLVVVIDRFWCCSKRKPRRKKLRGFLLTVIDFGYFGPIMEPEDRFWDAWTKRRWLVSSRAFRKSSSLLRNSLPKTNATVCVMDLEQRSAWFPYSPWRMKIWNLRDTPSLFRSVLLLYFWWIVRRPRRI